MVDEVVPQFLDTAISALRTAEEELQKEMQAACAARGFYWHTHHGIWQFAEPVLMFLIYRALILGGFPAHVAREVSYPKSSAKMDLGFFDGGNPDRLVASLEAGGDDDIDRLIGAKLPQEVAKLTKHLHGLPHVRRFVLMYWLSKTPEGADLDLAKFAKVPDITFRSAWHRRFEGLSRCFAGSKGPFVDAGGRLRCEADPDRRPRVLTLALGEVPSLA